MFDESDPDRLFVVVLNDEEQYSIWPTDRDVPRGWREEGFRGSRQMCLDHIDTVWTDMRPASLRGADSATSGGGVDAN